MGDMSVNGIYCDSSLSISSSTGNIQLGSHMFPSSSPVDSTTLMTDGNGSLFFRKQNVRTEVSSSSYNIVSSDDIVGVTGDVAVSLILPDPASRVVGDLLYIVRETDSTEDIVVYPNGVELISGQTSYSMNSAFCSVSLYTNGSNWFVVSHLN